MSFRSFSVSASLVASALTVALVGCGGVSTFSGQMHVQGTPPAPPPPPPPPPAAKIDAPVRMRVQLKDHKIVIGEKVQFEQNSPAIKAESNGLLDEVVEVIKKNPQIKMIDIEGHASAEGNEAANVTLSDARAKSVMAYLVGKGISDKILTAKGFGSSKPIADNATEDGREKNRRVEFNVTEGGSAPAPAATPAPATSGSAKPATPPAKVNTIKKGAK